MSFTEFFYYLVIGQRPDAAQIYFLDLLLVAIAEHGLTPTVQAARMTYDADPEALQGAVAAGILGCGTVLLGTAEQCGHVLVGAQQRIEAGENRGAVVRDIAVKTRNAGGAMPGFGHPLHKTADPRAERIVALATQRGIADKHVQLALEFRAGVEEVWGKPLPMNVSMPIAAVLLDLSFPAAMIKAIPILARTAGLLAHLAEERQNPIGFLMASHGEAAIGYDATGRE